MARQSGPRSGPRGRPGQRGPVFTEIIWLRRWPRLVSTCFIVLILLEILAFLWVADQIGLGLTLLALIGSAFIGLWLIRRTGLDMVGRLRLALAQGQEPGHSLIDGACFVVAGLLLILPGFFSDILALLLMLPATRNWLIRYFAAKMVGAGATGTSGGPRIITDVDFHEVMTRPPAPAAAPTSETPGDVATEAPATPTEAMPAAEPEILAPIRPVSPTSVPPTSIRPAPVPPVGEDSEADNNSGDGEAPASEDERWGHRPRRPIIDVEES